VAAPMVENEGSEIVLQNPGSGLRFGWKIAAADFDQDGVVDLAVANDADQSFTGAVYLYRGGPSLVGGEAWKKFTPPTAGAQYFGTSIAAGSVDGDANPDLIVGASTWQSSRGRVLLYFGQAGAGPDPAVAPVEFRGGHGVAGFFGSVVTVLPDLNGDGRSEIAVVASSDAGGRVYVYLGRTQAQWAALATEIEGDGVGFVSVHQADAVIQGPAPVAGQVALFGRDAGGTSVGDLNGDGVPEIAVAASRSSVGTVYIFSGAFIASRQGPTLDERAIVLDDAIQILSEPLTSTLNQGFGFEMRGSINLSGTESPDLLVSLSRKSQIFLYEAQSNGLFGPSTLLFEGPADRYFGNGLASGDVNGDGVPDLVVGENPPVGVTESEGWVMYHQGGGTEPFGRRIPNFTMSRLRSAHPSRGLDVEVVDLTGDGLPDVVTTEMLNPPGRVYVRH